MSRKKKILAIIFKDLDRLFMTMSIGFFIVAIIGDTLFDKPSGEYRYLFIYAALALAASFTCRITQIFLESEETTQAQK